MQNTATTAPTSTSVEEACETLDLTTHNAVVNEKSNHDDIDINAHAVSSLQHIVFKLKAEAANQNLYT